MRRYDSRQLSITWIPAAGALVTGVLAGTASWALARLVEYPRTFEVAAAIGAVAALLAWFAYRAQAVELFRGLNGIQAAPAAPIEEPKAQDYAATVRIDLIQEDSKAGQFIDLPARPEQLAALADGLRSGRQFAQSGWVGSGQPFTRPEFEALRGELLRRGLATWNNPRAPAQGCSLTHAGRAILKHFEREVTPPPGYQAIRSA